MVAWRRDVDGGAGTCLQRWISKAPAVGSSLASACSFLLVTAGIMRSSRAVPVPIS